MQGQNAEDQPVETEILFLGKRHVVESLTVKAVEFFELFFRDPPLVDYQGGAGFEARTRRLWDIGVAARRIDDRKRVIRIMGLCHDCAAATFGCMSRGASMTEVVIASACSSSMERRSSGHNSGNAKIPANQYEIAQRTLTRRLRKPY
jgi:hypothetical protein